MPILAILFALAPFVAVPLLLKRAWHRADEVRLSPSTRYEILNVTGWRPKS